MDGWVDNNNYYYDGYSFYYKLTAVIKLIHTWPVRVGKARLFTWTGQSFCLYCTRCAVSYCLWHLLSVKNIWFHYPLSEEQEWESWLECSERSGGRVWFIHQMLANLDLSILSLLGKRDVMFSSLPQVSASQKAFLLCWQRNHTTALLWNDSS